jgi:threonine dehydrogenase-like Zn-dependent dehydrogenase
VIVLGRRPERLALAHKFGADVTLSCQETSAEERRQWVFDRPRGQGADVVAEFIGSPQAVEEGTRLVRPGGRYLWGGNWSAEPGRRFLVAEAGGCGHRGRV